jgi:hypothetical protein
MKHVPALALGSLVKIFLWELYSMSLEGVKETNKKSTSQVRESIACYMPCVWSE